MRKVVINTCYGGFGLSDEASELYLKKKNIDYVASKTSWGESSYTNKSGGELYSTLKYMDRHDPDLVSVVEELGTKASGPFAELSVREVYGRYRINEYDGRESIEEEGDYSGWK